MNKVILIGRLTKDPELRYTPNGVACCQFVIALDRGKDKDGNDRGADFPMVNVWEKQAENVNKYLKKGSLIGVEGQLKTRNYDDKDGKRVYVTEVQAQHIQFLDSKKDERPLPPEPDYLNNTTLTTEQIDEIPLENDPFANFEEPSKVNDSDLPF